MTPQQKQNLAAIEYLVSRLPPKIAEVCGEQFPIVQTPTIEGMAAKLRIDAPTAQALADAFQAAGIIYGDQFTGFYNTAMFNLDQGGYAYQIVARQSRPITAAQVLVQIPRGAFGGDRISLQAALLRLVAAGYVTTSDNGASFLPS